MLSAVWSRVSSFCGKIQVLYELKLLIRALLLFMRLEAII